MPIYGSPECTGGMGSAGGERKPWCLLSWWDRYVTHPFMVIFLLALTAECIVLILNTAEMMEAATGNCADFTVSTEPGTFEGRRRMGESDTPKINDPNTPNVLLIVVDDLRFDAPWLADAPNYR